ncbi:MAG: EF-P beta-lysylation protein EpmB [Pseudomonadota bacterium]
MITRSAPGGQDWTNELAEAFRETDALCKALDLTDPQIAQGARQAAAAFPLRVTRSFAARMTAGNLGDPLLRQVLPLACEQDMTPGFNRDPVGDLTASPVPGLIHKYHGRALLMLTGVCPVHCRYCFRRHFPYTGQGATQDRWPAIRTYLTAHPEIREIILSGGDPLTLSDRHLGQWLDVLAGLPQIVRLRLHTRVPVVLPNRITEPLVRTLTGSRLPVVVVIHCNHPGELDESARQALQQLKSAGMLLLNQSVLLRGVNDQAEILVTLSEALMAAGVVPYYLHQLDPVAGAAHFQVPDPEAARLLDTLAARLPGYLVPRWVREIPGASSKQTPHEVVLKPPSKLR